MSAFSRFDPFFFFSSSSSSSALFSPPAAMSGAAWGEYHHQHHHHHLDDHPDLDLALDLLNPAATSPFDLPLQCLVPPPSLAPLDLFAADFASFRRFQERAETEMYLRSLSDRVTALELGQGFGLGRQSRPVDRQSRPLDRKYTWTAEIKDSGAVDRKYKWVAEAKGCGEKGAKWIAEFKEDEGFDRKYKWVAEAKAAGDGNVKWTTEIKGKGPYAPASRTYTWQASTKPSYEEEPEEIKEKKLKKGKIEKKEKKEKGKTVHLVEIEEKNPGAIAIRKVFAKAYKDKGKRKILSPPEAASFIQKAYRDHLARRAMVLRCLRELAVAKARLKDLRDLFANFSYRRHIAKNAEERQKFTDKIIVLHLTVQAIEGPDFMVRTAKKSMIEELEFMLQVVDPQLASMKQRKFDLPEGTLSKEMMAGVAEMVRMLDHE